MNPDQTGAHMFAPDIPSYPVHSSWLTVAEAVLRCTERGLSRTPKTLRRWAALSHKSPDTGDFSVRRDVTDNGYRWLIEASSLDRKIDEELEFEAQKKGERVQTGAHMSEPVRVEESPEPLTEQDENLSEPVRTSAHMAGQEGDVQDELRAQLEQAKAEVEFLRGELIHRRETDKALGSVIEAFKLNAETTQAQLLDQSSGRGERQWADQRRHDIVPNGDDEQHG